MKLISFAILFLTVTSLYAQRDSIIYLNNENIQKNPYKKQLKKYYKEYNKKVTYYQDVESPELCHSLYFVENRDTIFLDKAIINEKIGANYTIIFTVKVDWQSIIREITILSVNGNPDLNKFRDFCNGLLVKPLYHFGLPDDDVCKCAQIVKNE